MLLTMNTVQVTVPPPPLPEPSHWVTDVVSRLDDDVDVVQVGGALAAPWHCLIVTVELVAPVVRSRLLVTVTAHATACPPTLSVPLHWLMAAAAVTAARAATGLEDAAVTAALASLAPVPPGIRNA